MRVVLSFFCFSVEFVFIFVLMFLYFLVLPVGNEKIVKIERGSATKTILMLSKTHTNFNSLDPQILYFLGHAQEGYLELSGRNLSKIDFLKEITTAKPLMDEFMLIPGETTIVFLKNLADKFSLNFQQLEQDYNASSPFYEGFLVPDTYRVSYKSSQKEIITHLIAHAKKFHENLSKELLGEYNENRWHEILIKASIIQKEAADTAEMPLISSVIDNRLAKNMKLQMDGTLNYGEFSHKKVTAQRIREDESSYNTYLHEGLPKQPVCTISKEAIIAAIKPQKSEYLYFVIDRNSGKHSFSKSYSEHLKNINK